MHKYIFIVNGLPRCGKDTFAKILGGMIPTYKCSSVDKIKYIARECGWDKDKSEKGRKFLSDLKAITTEYNDLAFNELKREVEYFKKATDYRIMLIDIREPEEIDRAVVEFGAKSILIENDRCKHITSNNSDARVFDYVYDYTIDNNGTLDDFKRNIAVFLADALFDYFYEREDV
jgi:dephospho-CoA kinase